MNVRSAFEVLSGMILIAFATLALIFSESMISSPQRAFGEVWSYVLDVLVKSNATDSQIIQALVQLGSSFGFMMSEQAKVWYFLLILSIFFLALGVGWVVLGFTQMSFAQRLTAKIGKGPLLTWFLLPYLFQGVDLAATYLNSILWSGFATMELNPEVVSLFSGQIAPYLLESIFASLLITPVILVAFYLEEREKMRSIWRKLVVLIVSSPSLLGLFSNVYAFMYFISI